jgi:1-acyl-sn-glycerol-3-phosphate acyltransferase
MEKLLVHGDWRDSGDLGYVAEGEVYITGRIKDVIIRAGRNLYPHELEETVGAIPGVRKGCVAVFGSPDPATGTERLVILAETREQGKAELEKLRQAVQDATVDLLGTPADEVVLAPPHTVPKTSSGKVRRSSAREIYESGRIGRGGAALGWQLVRLAATGFRTQLARGFRTFGRSLYGVWAWLVVGLCALPVVLSVTLAPGLRTRRRLARGWCRLMLRLMGIPVRVEGAEHLAGGGPWVVAANHGSHLDGFVMMAVLPPDLAFVAKREFEGNIVARTMLRSVGAVFVERFDPARGLGETRKALEAVQEGSSLAIFPEGTFRRYPGLLPFRMGAFAVAVDAGVPVLPVIICGARVILPGHDLMPRPGAVTVIVAPPVHPQGSGWHAGVQLRDEVRAAMLERCGEPDLA